MKSLLHIDHEDFLYLIFNNVDVYVKENNEINCWDFTFADENEEALKKHT